MEIEQRIGAFFAQFPLNHFSKSDIILGRGSYRPNVHYLVSGLVTEYCLSVSGGMFTLHVYHPGSFFPLCFSSPSGPGIFILEALTPVQTRSCPPQAFIDFVTTEKDLMLDFTSLLTQNLSAISNRLGIIANSSAYGRAVSVILLLGEKFGKKVGGNGALLIEHPFSHREIASWMGTTRETASIKLKQLERAGLIKYHLHRILIPDLSSLSARAED